MDFIYFPVIPAFYNPFGVPAPTTTSAVTYNGTPKTGGGTNNATYSMTANEVLSSILVDIFNEWHVAYLRDAANETNTAANTAAITTILAVLAALKTSSLKYDGTVKTAGAGTATYSMTADELLNTILVANWNEFTNVYSLISGISSGVSLSLLDTTLNAFVVPFVSGVTYSGHTLLTATFASGSAIINGQYTTYAGGIIGVSASQDNYVYLNRSNTLVYLHVNNGDPAPTTPANTILLSKLVTDGTTITVQTDLRVTKPFTASQIAALYANNTIPFAARIISEWADFILPVTSTTGKLLQSNGSSWTEGTKITVDETNSRVGINQATPLTALDVVGTIRLGDDSTNLANSIKAATGRLWFRNASAFVALASALTELSDLTITTQAANDVIAASSTTAWVNKPNGTVPISKTAGTAPLVVVQPTDVYIYVDVTANAVNVQLPDAALAAVRPYYIMHTLGDITTHNITISSVAGNIKGSSTLVLNTVAKNAVICIPNGVNWGCIAG